MEVLFLSSFADVSIDDCPRPLVDVTTFSEVFLSLFFGDFLSFFLHTLLSLFHCFIVVLLRNSLDSWLNLTSNNLC